MSSILKQTEDNSWLGRDAFTLLEVMIAIAIIAISLTAVFSSQGSGLLLSAGTDYNMKAALLSREKVAEFEAGIAEYVDDEGDFGENFPGYSWKVEVEEADIAFLSDINIGQNGPVYKVNLTVALHEEEHTYMTTYYSVKWSQR